jgi:iron(II)-dependent oxidoreductase
VRPLIANADALYDSATVAHDTRWDLPLPDLRETLRYLERVKDEVLARLAHDDADDGLRYFVALATLHEEMHCEAFTYTRQTLGYAPPRASMPGAADAAGPWPGDVEVAGGTFVMGASRSVSAFVFDNEKWAHEVEVAPFRIARAPVTNSEFAAFVEDGGYRERRFWSADGWHWREQAGAAGPVYWRREGARWLERTYERYEALRPHVPVIHVSWHEAQAYCRWAGRRLPTEAEWEFAAATAPGAIAARRRFPWGDAMPDARRANLCGGPAARVEVAACEAGDSAWGCRQMIGNVWEWTADWFQPYPGFSPDPYKEYSAPWFGDHKVLRGGCHATRDIVVHNGFRNFYTPDRRDVYAGFRTCAA